jgi:hypothetical protein
MIKEIAPVAATARMFGVTEEQAAIVMLKGHELRLGLAASFEFIHVIENKPSISPKGCLALIHSSGELADLKIEDIKDGSGNPVECQVYMERINGFKYTITYSMDDAKRANLVKPSSAWEKYPANMLRWRAVGYCADVVFPDVIGGMSRPEELGADVDEGGEPVVWSEVTTTRALPPAPHSLIDKVAAGIAKGRPIPCPSLATMDPDIASVLAADEPAPDLRDRGVAAEPPIETAGYPATIDALIAAGYTAEQIVVANEGRVPSTAADCIRVAKILEEQA